MILMANMGAAGGGWAYQIATARLAPEGAAAARILAEEHSAGGGTAGRLWRRWRNVRQAWRETVVAAILGVL
jgi:hypothetical protein